MLRKLQKVLALGALLWAFPAKAQDPTDASSPKAEPPEAAEPAAEPVGASEPAASDDDDNTAPSAGRAESGHEDSSDREDTEPSPRGHSKPGEKLAAPAPAPKKTWEFSVSGYFRAPMALGFSKRPGPDDLTGKPQLQISYGPNRTVDANYFSFAYTRLQEQDWVELFVHAKSKHVETTVGWMGYWFATAGFRNPDAAWIPGVAYLTLNTDFELGSLKPNIALSGGSWWPKFGRHEKYDTYTLGQYRQLGEQLKLTLPVTEDIKVTVVQGLGTGRDGNFNIGAPPPYQAKTGLNLLHYAHLQFNYGKWLELGVHHNLQWTRDPNLFLQTSGNKSYANAAKAKLTTLGAELRASAPYVGSLWVSPSYVSVKNGWALGEAGVEVVHGLSPEGVAANYLAWTGSPADSTGSGSLLNLGFLYENTLANVLGHSEGSAPALKFSAFGLLVDATLDLPEGSTIQQNKIRQFKSGADLEYNPWKWVGLMLRFDSVNYDLDHPGYIFSAITSRLSLYSDLFSGERIYLQYSRYRYGDRMVLAGVWPWGVPLVAGNDILQGGPYVGSTPDMDVVRIQADIHF